MCGATTSTRQYHRIGDRYICEHCLLEARKRLAGLIWVHPYEDFAESLQQHSTSGKKKPDCTRSVSRRTP